MADRIFALIPYFGTSALDDAWLLDAVKSLRTQTRRLQGVLVVDDCSPRPPDAALRALPRVSLYRNTANTGPFGIDDAVFAGIEADAILLQDSDDWSAPERLAMLLEAMEREQADLVGCQIVPVDEYSRPVSDADAAATPLDPRAVLLRDPVAHTLNLPSSLVSCGFVRRIGGLSSGLRFGADSEFIRRAALGGRALNIGFRGYYRRVHPRSLTQAPATGFGSPARLAVQADVQASARKLVSAVLAGETPDLRPIRRAPLSRLVHVSGPRVPGLG